MFESSRELTLDGKTIKASLKFNDNGTVTSKVEATNHSAEITWRLNVQRKSIQLAVNHPGHQAACIIACLGKEVGKAIVECLLNSKNLTEIEACLRGKAMGTLVDVIFCVAGCLGLV